MDKASNFRYKPVDGGFEIHNGTYPHTRPLYAPHIRDDGRHRYLYFVGDQPDVAASMATAGKRTPKLGNLFFGIKGGKWFNECEQITARYIWGRMEYEIADPTFTGSIYITYVRSTTFDGLLAQITLPQELTDKLVIAAGARNNDRALQFQPEQCEETVIKCDGNQFSIEDDKLAPLHGLVNIPVEFTIRDAKAYNNSMDQLLESASSNQPLAVGCCTDNQKKKVYIALTTDAPNLTEVQDFIQRPQEIFEQGINYFRQLSEIVKIDTPDPYLNSALPAQVLAMDAAWNAPTIMHGAINWHTPHAGWRSTYGFTACGWHDRVQLNAKQYMKSQTDKGRITDFPTRDKRYNMGEVLVDQLLYDWLWSGDLEFMKNGGYQFIAKHLQHQDDYLQVPGMELYENWLNAWNTDNKWHNGGAGIISSSYTWHAYYIMADIATRLGKEEDAKHYAAKADGIRNAAQQHLWSQNKGVFGEYRDGFGLKRLHDVPDLSSIYTPIDVGLVDEFSGHQMLRYTEYAIEDITDLPRNGRILWSSNWLPPVYSSMGLYPDELVNLLLAYYQMGKPASADRLLRGILVALYAGEGPSMVSHMLNSDGTNSGHRDFSDVTSMFMRTVIEGLFGISHHAADNNILIKPMFPREWKTASITSPKCGLKYQWDGITEKIELSSEGKYNYSLELLARKTSIVKVVANEEEVAYSLRAGIDGTYLVVNIPKAKNITVQVVYGEDELPQLTYTPFGAEGTYSFAVDRGTITKIHDPQDILNKEQISLQGSRCTVELKNKSGWHTFFAQVIVDDISTWLPVDLELREPVEIVGEEIISINEKTYCRFALRNNTQEILPIAGKATFASSQTTFIGDVSPGEQLEEITIEIQDMTLLTPGSNRIVVEFVGELASAITKNLVNWDVSAAKKHKQINLDAYVNQDLEKLHLNTYGDRLDKFYWVGDTPRTVLPNGRGWWETGRGQNCLPVLDKLPQEGEKLVTDIGVPFAIANTDKGNAVFTSLYQNHPEQIKINLNDTGRKLYFLLAVSTNHMQSQLENARITVNFADGTRETLPLINPDNIDDWLSYQTKPYAKTGYIQALGDGAHANIIDLDFGRVCHIKSVDFLCLSNEVLAGLLGITLVE